MNVLSDSSYLFINHQLFEALCSIFCVFVCLCKIKCYFNSSNVMDKNEILGLVYVLYD